MSQQKSSQQARSAAPSTNQSRWRRRVMLGLALGLCLFAALGIAAQQRARQSPRKTEPSARPANVLAPSSLTPSAPAKEYIYAGGKLLATEEQRFEDVPISHPYYNDIDKIAELGVTLGCATNPPLYCVNDNVTRGQMAAFIMRALGVPNPPTPAQQRFNDVPPSHPFYAHIEEMAVRKITLGCSASPPLYCPDSHVTHEQMAAFMDRAYLGPNWQSLPPPNPTPPQSFCDIPLGHSFYYHIHSYATVRQAWQGCNNTGSCPTGTSCQPPLPCFCPTDLVRRDQMARILVRNFNL